MTDWIEWHGGECPVKSDKTRGNVAFRDGDELHGKALSTLDWRHLGLVIDIIAYRITENHEPAEIDLTTNTTPWGLCSDEWKEDLRVYRYAGGEVECYGEGGWENKRVLGWLDHLAYRAKNSPVVTVEDQEMWANFNHSRKGYFSAINITGDCMEGTMTTTFHDGKPVKAEWVAK